MHHQRQALLSSQSAPLPTPYTLTGPTCNRIHLQSTTSVLPAPYRRLHSPLSTSQTQLTPPPSLRRAALPAAASPTQPPPTPTTTTLPPSAYPSIHAASLPAHPPSHVPTNTLPPWTDGDVLQLQLASGRHVFAEVLAPASPPPPPSPASPTTRQKAQSQPKQPQRRKQAAARQGPNSRSAAAVDAAPAAAASMSAPAAPATPPAAAPSAPHAASPSAPQLVVLCGGRRYLLRRAGGTGAEGDGAAGTAADTDAASGRSRQQQVQQEGHWVLESYGGALLRGDPLLALLAAPPRNHAAALRAWSPLVGRLASPAESTPPPPPAPTCGETRQSGVSAAAAAEGGAGGGGGGGGNLDGFCVLGVRRLAGLSELRNRAAKEPGVWCEGSGPNDPPLTDSDLAIHTAGELLSLLEGRRGVVLLQLHIGWDEQHKIPPYGPFKPLVLRLLHEVLLGLDVVSYPSVAPAAGGGSAALGLTMVLAADKEPFRSWGAHLASFGCQAALEAQSPYYKLLVGRVLGYHEHNILHHIQTSHGATPSPEVRAAVDQELTKLSAKRPVLPWNASARGSRRKAA